MARPRSDIRENAIVEAAIGLFAAEGLGASTMAIAKAAGVSNGSLFTYFPTKADLINRLYRDLKAEMANVTGNFSDETDLRGQLHHAWRAWLSWAAAFPSKRRTLALLTVSELVSLETRQAGDRVMGEVAVLVDACRRTGALRTAPIELTVAVMMAMADATADFILTAPEQGEVYSKQAFEALWSALT